MSNTVDTATEIRPFQVDFSQEEIDELRRRVAATRWPTKELVDDRSQGVQLAAMRELARYWTAEYDWRRCEARLNALPQFMTQIDGVDVHFIHVKSRHENALPGRLPTGTGPPLAKTMRARAFSVPSRASFQQSASAPARGNPCRIDETHALGADDVRDVEGRSGRRDRPIDEVGAACDPELVVALATKRRAVGRVGVHQVVAPLD